MARKKNVKLDTSGSDTHQNTAKEQPYLMPGTSEYRERCEDLQMHDPFKPDDEFHKKLEEHNENHTENIAVKNKSSDSFGKNMGKRGYAHRMAKLSEAKSVMSAAMSRAERTESKDDDNRVKRRGDDLMEKLSYDEGVTDDEMLPKALRKFGL